MSILFYCNRGHSLSVSPALAGKKVRCPVCLEVVIAPHVAIPVEEEAGRETVKHSVVPPDPTPVLGETSLGGSALEIPDNPTLAPLGPNVSPYNEEAEDQSSPDLEIPDHPSILPLPPKSDQPLPPAGTPTLPVAEPLPDDLWNEVPAKKASPAIPPPLPTDIQELSTARPADAPTPPVAIPVFAQPYAVTEGRPPEVGTEEEAEYADDVAAVDRSVKPSRRKERRQQIRKVQLGLGFHFWKYLTYVLGINLTISGVILATFLPLLGILVVAFGYVAMLVSPVLGIVGSILCTAVPAKTEAKPLISVSLGLDASCLILGFLGGFIGLVTRTLPGAEGIAFLVFLIFSIACGLGGFVMFMLFLRKFATFLDDHKTADEAMTQMINLLAVVVGGGAIIIITAAILFNIEAWLAALGLGLEYLSFFILYLKVLFSILDVISTLRARIN
jgi:cytochrome b subunit of formate dehydrogenase